jgi:hypothetical protein
MPVVANLNCILIEKNSGPMSEFLTKVPPKIPQEAVPNPSADGMIAGVAQKDIV